MSHPHTSYTDQLLVWYRNYSNKLLFFETPFEITLNFKHCLHLSLSLPNPLGFPYAVSMTLKIYFTMKITNSYYGPPNILTVLKYWLSCTNNFVNSYKTLSPLHTRIFLSVASTLQTGDKSRAHFAICKKRKSVQNHSFMWISATLDDVENFNLILRVSVKENEMWCPFRQWFRIFCNNYCIWKGSWRDEFNTESKPQIDKKLDFIIQMFVFSTCFDLGITIITCVLRIYCFQRLKFQLLSAVLTNVIKQKYLCLLVVDFLMKRG